MHSPFLNPFSSALSVIAQYRDALARSLAASGLSEGQIDAAMAGLHVGAGPGGSDVDRGLWLTLRRAHRHSDKPFQELAAELQLSAWTRQAFGRIQYTYAHQEEAIRSALAGAHTVIATGTGSGKTEAFLIPVVELCCRCEGPGVKTIIVYPMNAVAREQTQRIGNCLSDLPVRVGRFTGDIDRSERNRILADPPDILVTNHVMLERILTLDQYQRLRGIDTLRVVVVDEVHTFRGNRGADVAWLIRRLKAQAGTSPLCIGASATLRRHGGYLAATQQDEEEAALRRFLGDLLALDRGEDLRVVKPSYVPQPTEGGCFPEPDWQRLKAMDWSDDLDAAKSMESALFGLPEPDHLVELLKLASGEVDRSADVDAPDAGVASHALTRAWRRALIERGAISYGELVELTEGLYARAHGRPCPSAEALTRAALTAINYANWQASGASQGTGPPQARPLDLVIHLVLRNITGVLKRCMACERLQMGVEAQCSRCGRALLGVWRDDPAWAIAWVNTETHHLLPGPDYGASKTHPVRVASGDEQAPAEDSFRASLSNSQPGAEALPFVADESGSLVIARLPDSIRLERTQWAISPVETRHSLDHLVGIARALLSHEGVDGRLLVFGNAREQISTVGYILKEDSAHRYLLRIARQDAPELPVPLPLALSRIRAAIADADDPFIEELRRNLPHWFARLCATSPRLFPEHYGLLQLGGTALSDDSAEPAELLRICLEEGALDYTEHFEQPGHEDRRLFELDHLQRTRRKMVSFCAGGACRGDAEVRRLTKDGLYADAIAGREAEFAEAAERLVAQGVLRRFTDVLEGGDPAYALSTASVCLAPADDDADGGTPGAPYQAVGTHTSEAPPQERGLLEEEFRRHGSCLSTLVATSTLEMGVDFPLLRHVVCYGVPPDPASYAQRAGRAGRGTNAWYALTTTWCEEWNDHDMFHFNHPEELRALLAGQVALPTMDAGNLYVARRHLFAMAVRDRLADRSELATICRDPRLVVYSAEPPLLSAFREALGDQFERIVGSDLPVAIQKLMETDHDAESWFNSEMCPDYGFRRDSVVLLLPQDEDADRERCDFDIVSERAPEQAITTWFADRVVPTARGLVRIESGWEPGTYPAQRRSWGAGRWSPYQRHFWTRRERGFHGRRSRRPAYDIRSRIDARPPAEMGPPRWLAWQAVADAPLSIRNHGPKGPTDRAVGGPLQFETRCDSFLVYYDSVLISKAQRASLACLLVHAIQTHFRLAEGDLVFLDAVDVPRLDFPYQAFAFADAGHHGLIPMARLEREVPDLLREAVQCLEQCSCSEGCHLCLRTYSTAFIGPEADKATALHLARAALGETPFTPDIPPMPATEAESGPGVVIRLRKGAGGIIWERGDRPSLPGYVREHTKASWCEAFVAASADIPCGSTLHVECEQWVLAILTGSQKTPKWSEIEERAWLRALRHRIGAARTEGR